MNPTNMITITVELGANEAAALRRLCNKITHSDAMQYLYPHVPKATRDAQAYHMMHATNAVYVALYDAGVTDLPWIESGSAE